MKSLQGLCVSKSKCAAPPLVTEDRKQKALAHKNLELDDASGFFNGPTLGVPVSSNLKVVCTFCFSHFQEHVSVCNTYIILHNILLQICAIMYDIFEI